MLTRVPLFAEGAFSIDPTLGLEPRVASVCDVADKCWTSAERAFFMMPRLHAAQMLTRVPPDTYRRPPHSGKIQCKPMNVTTAILSSSRLTLRPLAERAFFMMLRRLGFKPRNRAPPPATSGTLQTESSILTA